MDKTPMSPEQMLNSIRNLNRQTRGLNDQVSMLMETITPMINKQVDQAIDDGIKDKIEPELEKNKKEMADFTKRQINEVKKVIPLNDGEATNLQRVVQSRAAVSTHSWISHRFRNERYGSNYGGNEFFSKKYGHFIRYFYGALKKEFNQHKYTTILHSDYEDALKYANTLNWRSLPTRALRITPKQLEVLNAWESRKQLSLTQPDD